jgi:hypothetical protein
LQLRNSLCNKELAIFFEEPLGTQPGFPEVPILNLKHGNNNVGISDIINNPAASGRGMLFSKGGCTRGLIPSLTAASGGVLDPTANKSGGCSGRGNPAGLPLAGAKRGSIAAVLGVTARDRKAIGTMRVETKIPDRRHISLDKTPKGLTINSIGFFEKKGGVYGVQRT